MHKRHTIVLDVDGVIFDSNGLKAKNIQIATSKYCDEIVTDNFVKYFVSLNGVPRQIKIFDYFVNDLNLASKILNEYNTLVEAEIKGVQFTYKAFETIQELAEHYNLIALSGAEKVEIEIVFDEKGIFKYFSKVLGGPMDKFKNAEMISNENIVFFIGDSIIDQKVANSLEFPFVFMYGYSQVSNWEQVIDKSLCSQIIRDLSLLNLSVLKEMNC